MGGRDDVEVRASTIHGSGVFAKRSFPRGERIFALDDSRVVDDDHPLDPEKGEFEVHCDWLGDLVVHMGEPERYVNHCCEPSCFIATDEAGGRWLVAYRDVEAGEELTCDYLIDGDGGVRWACSCGHPDCRGHHIHDFFALPDHKQREYLPLLAPWFVEGYAGEVAAIRRSSP